MKSKNQPQYWYHWSLSKIKEVIEILKEVGLQGDKISVLSGDPSRYLHNRREPPDDLVRAATSLLLLLPPLVPDMRSVGDRPSLLSYIPLLTLHTVADLFFYFEIWQNSLQYEMKAVDNLINILIKNVAI